MQNPKVILLAAIFLAVLFRKQIAELFHGKGELDTLDIDLELSDTGSTDTGAGSTDTGAQISYLPKLTANDIVTYYLLNKSKRVDSMISDAKYVKSPFEYNKRVTPTRDGEFLAAAFLYYSVLAIGKKKGMDMSSFAAAFDINKISGFLSAYKSKSAWKLLYDFGLDLQGQKNTLKFVYNSETGYKSYDFAI